MNLEPTIFVESQNFEYRNENGKLHRIDGPASVEYNSDGSRTEKWYKNGLLHRIDGPARIEYLSNGDRCEEWFNEGKRYRENNLPRAYLIQSDNSMIEYWWL
jgi:hypothetical protein